MSDNEEILTEGTIVFIANEPWILQADVRAKRLPPFKCPHCGGTKGTWFDRSSCVDSRGYTVEPMCDRCRECGKAMP